MLYLIDGSNVLGSMGRLKIPGSNTSLLAMIDRFCKVNRHRAVVVFDGMEGRSPGQVFAFGEKTTVMLPIEKHGSDRADRLLMKELDKRGDHGSVIAVTSDRHLASGVRALGAKVVQSDTFAEELSRPCGSVVDDESEKEIAARGIDNAELLRIWSSSGEDSANEKD